MKEILTGGHSPPAYLTDIQNVEIHIDPKAAHPVQTGQGKSGSVSTDVSMAAYEVYCHVYTPQDALVTGECRGGFSTGELIALLYARSFSRTEWSFRVKEAYKGMVGI